MFDFLLKPNFYTKCKSAIKMIKLRLETIKKKRNAVEKYLKNDVADLLKNGLDENAYGRASGLLMEQKRTACYDFIEQFCECISKNLSVMQKQSECPEECREAVPSLLYAAARFADLPELRDLRTIFTEKYGNSLDSYLNQEFVQKLKAEPPTKDTKLQLMHDIAQEFSFEWDSKALEQKLFKPPPLEQNNADDDRYNLYRSKNNTFEKSNNEDENGLSNLHGYRRQKGNEADLTSRGRMEDTDDKFKQNSSSEDEVTDQDIPKGSSATDESVSEDGIENRKPFYYRFIPPPYVRPALGKEKSITEDPMAPNDNTENENNNKWNEPVAESKPEPRSVWRRPLRPPPGSKGLSGFGNNVAANMSRTSTQMEGSDKRDEEEKRMDELLVHYSKKKSPFEWVSRWKTAILAPPPGKQESEGTSKAPGLRSTKSNPISLPGRVASFSKETTSSTERAGRHTRAASDGFAGHVHPKLPDYDDLATRLAALRRQ
ncbi:hypothetical protein ES319_D05G132500v1 [Gossypium barbadense]|uniref:IST1-like protein n=3 Tax=Gossypium TaxID=3633 RepID=A0A5J5RC50_GOSBA|nr:hypothetical protein ES319_D05G132500v1 [Gossypium barbadense]TYG68241.1 hypothetical protein ES288_D05G138400v1 [Gossypium darwinii]TYH70776.1 hypothetical protein ES332_D05G139800v1 [Gossypium tomentosum]